MADFLASFNLGAEDAAHGRPPSCASIEDVQLSLGDLLADKATATRAQHVAATLDVSASASFNLSLSQREKGLLESLNNVDPSLGGLRSSSVATDNPGEHTPRLISAADALANQPQDDPVLQRAMARHIVSALGTTDGSAWVMRDMSRGPHGWTFTYLCRHSLQHWDRQNKAKAVRPVIGEYTQRDPDPVLMSRPAFDCRGTVNISFSRSSRSISIKYDHTPLHKTVAQVAELFKPPPRQASVCGPQNHKSPKKPASARKRRESAQGESGKPRKRKKGNDGQAQAQAQAAAPGHDVQPAASLPQDHAQAADGGLAPGGLGAADASAADTAQTGGLGPVQPSAAPGASFPINISPSEAARCRGVATRLLTDAGVDPDSLSAEQFNIFANQSPDLQKESLNMLVKYGAERLRIVHPSNRDSSTSASASASASPAQASQATPSGPMTTKELVPRPSAAGDEADKAAKGSKRKYRKLGKSRNACLECKRRRVKCPREKPTCSECQTAQLACEYAPPKPRLNKKSDAMVPADDEAQDESQLEQAHQQEGDDEEGEEAHAEADEELDDDEQPEQEAEGQGGFADYSPYPQVPVADMLTPNVDVQQPSQAMHNPQPPYFRSASGLVLPQPEEPPVSRQMHTASSGLVLPQGTVHFPPLVAQTADAPLPRLDPKGNGGGDAVQRPASPEQGTRPTGSSWTRSREDAPASPQAAFAWPGGVNPGGQTATAAPTSPPVHQRAVGGHGARVSNQRRPAGSPQLHDAVALSQAALEHQRQAQNVSAAMQASSGPPSSHPPDGSRATSRQGQRAQTAAPEPAAVADAAPDLDDTPVYDGYGRYPDGLPSEQANRIAYEPYSYWRAPYPAYDYGRGSAATTMPAEAPPVPPTAPALASAAPAPDPLPASRGRAAPTPTGLPYTKHAATARASASAHDFSMWAAASQPARPGHGALNHQQHQQHQHQHQHRQPGPQGSQSLQHGPPSWYGFGNASNSNSATNDAGGGSSHHSSYALGSQRPSYAWKLPDESWGGVS